MTAVPEDQEAQPDLRSVSAEAAPAERASRPGDPEVRCSEDGSRCLSREEMRAIIRRVVAEHQRAFALLEAYDKMQPGAPDPRR